MAKWLYEAPNEVAVEDGGQIQLEAQTYDIVRVRVLDSVFMRSETAGRFAKVWITREELVHLRDRIDETLIELDRGNFDRSEKRKPLSPRGTNNVSKV